MKEKARHQIYIPAKKNEIIFKDSRMQIAGTMRDNTTTGNCLTADYTDHTVNQVIINLQFRELTAYCCETVVAGKGHETYQEQNGQTIHFDDREIIAEICQP